MKLSIITVCYNDKVGLIKTSESICSQKFREFEWIIIDGGSKDGCKDVIESLASNPENNISYWCSEPDKGIYNGMNKGIAKSKGEYLLFMNSGDCIYDELVLENVIPLLQGKSFYIGNIVVDTNGVRHEVKIKSDISPADLLYRFAFRAIPHQATFIRKTEFEKYGDYREDLRVVSDWYHFYSAIVLGGASVGTLPYVIALYDGCGLSSTDSSKLSEREKSLDHIPLQRELFEFYHDNYDVMSAFKSNTLGRFVMRLYFFIYRKLLKKLIRN